MATTRRPRSDIKADSELVQELDDLKGELGTSSRTSTIRQLLVHYQESLKSREGLRPVSPAIMKDDRPALVTGTSGSGKTTAVKELLKTWSGPIFVLDVSGEYSEYSKVDLGKLSGNDWSQGGRLRFVPTTEISSQAESEAALQLLNLMIHSQGEPLKSWCIVLEEGQRFLKNTSFKLIIGEARKFTGKILVASQNWRPLKDSVDVFAPAPGSS